MPLTPGGRRSQAVLLEDVDSPQGGGTAYWPRSHLANHRYFLTHPDQFDGSYLYTEPVKSGGHSAILEGDPTVGEVTTMTGKAGDVVFWHSRMMHSAGINHSAVEGNRPVARLVVPCDYQLGGKTYYDDDEQGPGAKAQWWVDTRNFREDPPPTDDNVWLDWLI